MSIGIVIFYFSDDCENRRIEKKLESRPTKQDKKGKVTCNLPIV